jgi:Tfp pilus assembly protein PilO
MDKNSAIMGVFLLAIVGMLLRPLVMAWSRRIGGASISADLTRELDDLRERVAELEGAGTRLQELEERVDFAERMLAQRPEVARLPAEPDAR